METKPQGLQFMNSLFTKLRPKLTLTSATWTLKPFCSENALNPVLCSEKKKPSRVRVGATTNSAIATKLKENWLDSLSSPLPLQPHNTNSCNDPDLAPTDQSSNWVIGIDPDLSGAIALLKPEDDSGCSCQVFDTPHLKVMIGKKVRKRLDARSIVRLLRSFNAPIGTTAFIEQSIPFPKDGKQGWWSGGFGYGLWIGVLVASGFSVVPVPSFTWKNEFELSTGSSTKDDSRRIASTLFPSLSSMLQRKKDHGRAEALLIAAYGKGLKTKSGTCVLEEVP